MNLMLYFSRFRNICNRFCFVCIAVERIKRSEEDCLSSFFIYVPFLLPPADLLHAHVAGNWPLEDVDS